MTREHALTQLYCTFDFHPSASSYDVTGFARNTPVEGASHRGLSGRPTTDSTHHLRRAHRHPQARKDIGAPPCATLGYRVCKARSTCCPVAEWASVRSNRVVGWDSTATSERISRRAPSKISERLQYLGWRVARRGGGRLARLTYRALAATRMPPHRYSALLRMRAVVG